MVIHQLTDLSGGRTDANARIRREGIRNLVDAAQAAGAGRMIAQSISWAYQPGADPAAEDVPLDLTAAEPRLTTVTGVAELEAAVREPPEWVALRYGLLYGPGTWYAADGLIADRARAGQLTADADVSSFVRVDDAAGAVVAALSWPSGTVNGCDDEPAAGRDWLPVYCAAVGAPVPPEAGAGVTAADRHGWARGADNRHARKDLGWVPIHPSWRDGFTAA